MKTRLLVLCLIGLAAVIAADETSDNIYRLFERGNIAAARTGVQALPQSAARDGNRLFVASLFENEGASVENKLEAAIRSNMDGKFTEEAYFRLLQLAEAGGDTNKVLSAGKTFLETWETSVYRDQVLAMLAAHAAPGSTDQQRYLDLLIDGATGAYFGQYARIIKAEAAFSKKQFTTAATLCRKINNAVDDNLTPASLILLSKIGLRQDDAERALFNYNILHEQFRFAIGEGELLNELKRISENKSGQESTEVFEGITYSIQVGVFSEKENARTMEKRIGAYGYKTRITRRQISGKSYYVVMAGTFSTMQAAQTAKQKLESGENEIFKVTVNDEK